MRKSPENVESRSSRNYQEKDCDTGRIKENDHIQRGMDKVRFL